MITSYFELLGLNPNQPDWKLSGELIATIEELKKHYRGTYPDEFVLPLEVLEDEEQRQAYKEVLSWSQQEAVDFNTAEDAARAADKANSWHFKAEAADSASRLVIKNLGVPKPPSPSAAPTEPPAADSKPAFTLLRPPASSEGAQNYFDVLRIKKDTPEESIDSLLESVIAQLDEQEGRIPPHVAKALRVLRNPKARHVYRQFLHLSETNEPFRMDGQFQELRDLAGDMHFRLEDLGGDAGLMHNLRVESGGATLEPPPPPATPAERQAPQPRGQIDAYGRVDGEIPPIIIGSHSYHVEFTDEPMFLRSIIDRGDAVELHWVQPVAYGPPNRCGVLDYVGSMAPDGALATNHEYHWMFFRHSTSGQRHAAAYYSVTTGFNQPIIASWGFWDLFPWHLQEKHRNYNEAERRWDNRFPNRSCPPNDYFGTRGWNDYLYRDLGIFVESAEYWARVAMSDWAGWGEDESSIRQLSQNMTFRTLRAIAEMKPRHIQKLGWRDPEKA